MPARLRGAARRWLTPFDREVILAARRRARPRRPGCRAAVCGAPGARGRDAGALRRAAPPASHRRPLRGVPHRRARRTPTTAAPCGCWRRRASWPRPFAATRPASTRGHVDDEHVCASGCSPSRRRGRCTQRHRHGHRSRRRSGGAVARRLRPADAAAGPGATRRRRHRGPADAAAGSSACSRSCRASRKQAVPAGAEASVRVCLVPSADEWVFTSRDREEELAAFARRLKAERRAGRLAADARVAARRAPAAAVPLSRARRARAAPASPTKPATRCRWPPSRSPPRSTCVLRVGGQRLHPRRPRSPCCARRTSASPTTTARSSWRRRRDRARSRAGRRPLPRRRRRGWRRWSRPGARCPNGAATSTRAGRCRRHARPRRRPRRRCAADRRRSRSARRWPRCWRSSTSTCGRSTTPTRSSNARRACARRCSAPAASLAAAYARFDPEAALDVAGVRPPCAAGSARRRSRRAPATAACRSSTRPRRPTAIRRDPDRRAHRRRLARARTAQHLLSRASCCSRSAGPRSASGSTARGRRSSTCWAWRRDASRSRPSRSKTTPSSSRRRSCTSVRRAGAAAAGGAPTSRRPASSRGKRWRSIRRRPRRSPEPARDLGGAAHGRARRRADPAFHGEAGPWAAAAHFGQPARALSGLPVQVLRLAGAAASTSRPKTTTAARRSSAACSCTSCSSAFFAAWQAAGPRRHHRGHCCAEAHRRVRRGRRAALATLPPGEAAIERLRLFGTRRRAGHRATRAGDGSGARRQRRRAAAGVSSSTAPSRSRRSRRPHAHAHAARQGRSHRPARATARSI